MYNYLLFDSEITSIQDQYLKKKKPSKNDNVAFQSHVIAVRSKSALH